MRNVRQKGFTVWPVLGPLLAIFLVGFVVFAIMDTDLFIHRWFAPREEAIRRDTFEQSKAYNDGMQQELQTMMFKYYQTDDAHKEALASIILHDTAAYDVDKLQPELRDFVKKLRAERTGGSK